jgi:hypothetical protein
MYICKICNSKAKSLRGLAQHINKSHDISSKEYYIKYFLNNETPVCKNDNCQKEPNFKGLQTGYNEYCSKKCSGSCSILLDKKKETFLERYGVSTPLKLPHSQEKSKTTIKNFSNEKKKNIKQKQKKTCKQRYGDENYNNRTKAKTTYLKNYGVENASQTQIIKEKIKKTNLRKYGKEYFDNHDIIKNLCLEKYGVDNFFKVDEIKEKIKKTNLQKYGNESATKNKDIQQKIRNTREEKGDWLPLNEKTNFELYRLIVWRFTNMVIKNIPAKENLIKKDNCTISKKELLSQYFTTDPNFYE